MSLSRRALTIGLGLLPLSVPTSRSIAAAPADPIVFNEVASSWIVAPDGTWTVDAEVSVRAPKVNPSHVVRMPLSWSSSTERFHVVQARIDKADGRSVVMGPETMRDDPPTGDEYFHEFSDERRMIVTFDNVEPGDVLVVKSHRDVFRPRVPGGFMAAPVLDRSVDWEETNFTISVPADMPLLYETRGFDHQTELIKDRMMHYLHSPRVAVPAAETTVLSEFDRLPRFAVSTFRDWDEFASAYASVMLPHARVTPALATLAAKLTSGQNEPREQARLLYEWVRDNVRHIAIPLEQTHIDPNDAELVMNKCYGDDKDHVVLLYALLAARKIPAEIVLLNGSNSSTIADPPNIRPMDHLILFLPTFNVYVDTTLKVAPFGVLAFGELGKPAIHLVASGDARRTIPIPASGATMARLFTEMTMAEDGTVTGTTKTLARGAFGVWLRNAARTYGQNDPASVVMLLREHATPGTGAFSFDPPDAPGDDYTVTGTFRLENQADLLHGGYFSPWTGLRILPRPGDVLGGPMFMRNLTKTEPTFCYPGIANESISLTLPPGRELGGLPPDVKIDSALVRYRSHWSMTGQRVSVQREFQSLAPGPVCQGPTRQDMAGVIAQVRADLLNPIGIKQDKVAADPSLAAPADDAPR